MSVESAPPSPRSFAGMPLTPVVHAVLGLYCKDALAWCVYAYLTRTGSAATAIAEAIVAHALPVDAVLEAIEAALTELEAEPDVLPSGIPGKITSLLTQRLAAAAALGGFALCFATLNIQATAGVANEEQGLAAGLLNTSGQVGGAVVLAVVTAVVDASGAAGLVSPAATLAAYRPALVLITIVAGIGTLTALSGLRRISRPGLRVYARKSDIPRVLGGLGIAIISTSNGLMTGHAASRAGLGGEVVAYVW